MKNNERYFIMASKLDLIVRKHVLPVLEEQGIEVTVRGASRRAVEAGFTLQGRRLYRRDLESGKLQLQKYDALTAFLQEHYTPSQAGAAMPAGQEGQEAREATATSVPPADPLAPQAGEIRTEARGAPAGSAGEAVPSVRLNDTYAGLVEDHLAAQGLTPEEQKRIDKRRIYLNHFVQEAGESNVIVAAEKLRSYFNEVREQYSFSPQGEMDDDTALEFAKDFARLASSRTDEHIARHYGDALENLLERDKTGRLAAEAAGSLPHLYKSLTVQSVDKFLTKAVQKIDEYNALPKRKHTKAAWEEVAAYFTLKAPQASADVQNLALEEHPQLLEDIAGIRREKSIVMGKLSVARNTENYEYHRAEAKRSEAATLRGDLETVERERNGYKSTNRALKYLAGVALLVGGLFGGAIGESCASRSDKQADDRQAHQMEVLQNENIRLEDSLKAKAEILKESQLKYAETKSKVKQLQQESAYAQQIEAALESSEKTRQLNGVIDAYILQVGRRDKDGDVCLEVGAPTCTQAKYTLHDLMGGKPETRISFAEASPICTERGERDHDLSEIYTFCAGE